jgi:hypothetical protein
MAKQVSHPKKESGKRESKGMNVTLAERETLDPATRKSRESDEKIGSNHSVIYVASSLS